MYGNLFSIQKIYSTLKGAANSWLSSQNQEAQQLSSNIEYMKYAMGSVFEPVIQIAVNLMYQLLKTIQSVVYAFSGINIFAKATASSMNKTTGSATKASKALSGVHGEINNLSSNDTDTENNIISPNLDLSQMSNTTDNIFEAIKNNNWSELGSIIGQKLNNAMDSIDWNSLQNKARNIANGITDTLNGFVKATDWYQIGNTLAQGINTVIYFAYDFVTTFNWDEFGISLGDSINGFFGNIDWSKAGETFGEGIKGIIASITSFIQEVDWEKIIEEIGNFILSIDWSGVAVAILIGICVAFSELGTLIVDSLYKVFYSIEEYFQEWINIAEIFGGDIIDGLLLGITNAIVDIALWIYDNLFVPFIEAFKEAFEIHSPSAIMQEQGQYIMQGLYDGIVSFIDKIKEIWNEIKDTISNTINEIKNTISNVLTNVKTIWENIWKSFSTIISDIWDGIWNTIKNIINSILGGIESMANGIVSGINKVIGVLNNLEVHIPDWVPLFGGKKIGFNIKEMNTISLPRLAKGNVAYSPMVAMFGEYSGARSNPEITTPQNIMAETFSDVLSNHEFIRGGNSPIQLAVYVGNKKLGDILLDNLRDIRRQTGSNLEAIVGG